MSGARWAGVHVIVTGGSEGIGAAVAAAFARRGARVSIIARRPEPLRDTALRLGADHRAADVTDRVALAAAIAELEARNGGCGVLACCAGLTLPGLFTELGDDEFAIQTDANYLGSVYAVRAVLPGMIERGKGHVLLLSSTSAFLGIPGYGAYAPTKASIRQLGLCLRYETEPGGGGGGGGGLTPPPPPPGGGGGASQPPPPPPPPARFGLVAQAQAQLP
ncbi:SDR family NAD(P)-dependent oxidoreductase, partial [Nocardia wallacei]|uniref:SDR family NAD(P)-dependent oxidoreductase n=1 Tax=Nocardia wallacei TaxID=480035 RepID=UPI0024549B23